MPEFEAAVADASPARAVPDTAAADAAYVQARRGPAGWVPGDDLPLTRWIVRHRVYIFAFAAVLYLLAFNGEWRVGRDSALYRGLAHSLATGQGYQFTDFSARQIYPGLPVLLAGLEKIFGQRDWPPIVMIHLFSLGCLVLTYRLVRLRFPQWLAVAVTACTAFHAWFLELTNEVRDDIPFLFGLLLALYGWERLRQSIARSDREPREGRGLFAPLALLLVGLGVAAVMRPTFWILAIAWVLVCAWGLIAGPHRKFYAICLAVLMAVWVAAIAVDPRTSGLNPLAGGYERDARASLANLGARASTNLPAMLGDGLAYGFFGQKWAPGLTQLINLALIGSSLLLLRRNPLWTLLILLTAAVTVVMEPVPRYYAMVLPLMALSWLLLWIEIAKRVPPRHFELAVLVGLVMMVGPNVARAFKVIAEQRTHERAVDGPKWKDVAEMSRRVSEIVPAGEKVIGPWAPIMSYLSGRHVVMSRDIIPWHKRPQIWPHHLDKLGIRYAIFPARLYDDAERQIRFLIDRGVIVPTLRVARVGEEWVLAEIRIDVPPDGKDWRKRPIREATFTHKTTPDGNLRPSNEQLARRRRAQARARREAAERKAVAQARAKKQAKLERAQRLAAAERAVKARQKRARIRRAREAAAAAAATTRPAAATQPTSLLLPLPRDWERSRGARSEPVRGLRVSFEAPHASAVGSASLQGCALNELGRISPRTRVRSYEGVRGREAVLTPTSAGSPASPLRSSATRFVPT